MLPGSGPSKTHRQAVGYSDLGHSNAEAVDAGAEALDPDVQRSEVCQRVSRIHSCVNGRRMSFDVLFVFFHSNWSSAHPMP